MLFYICFTQILFSNSIFANVDKDTKGNELFSDVIRNISRVNNVLQELIKNYEHIEKLYQSHSFEEDISAGFEERSKSHNNKSKHATTRRSFLATQMFMLSPEDEDNASSEKEKSYEKKAKSKSRTKKNKKNRNKKSEKKHISEKSTSVSSESSSSEESVDSQRKANNKDNKKKVSDKKTIAHDKKTTEHVKKTTKKASKQTEATESTTTSTTELQRIVVSESPTDNESANIIPTNNIENKIEKEQPKLIKKIVRTETFRDNIWNEISKNKPIALETESVINFKSNPKTALILVTDNKNKQAEDFDTPEPWESSDQDSANNEMLKTDILRTAYGDACLKVVFRKCFKACKAAVKDACRFSKCKRDFKEIFKARARTGCIVEFNGNETTNETLRTVDNSISNKNVNFKNTYLSVLCSPSQLQLRSATIDKPVLTNKTTPYQQLNILRDRFEKACEKISREKCNNACSYAYKETCGTYNCNKSKKKALKKACKKQCKFFYKGRRDKKSKSSSSSGSSSSALSSSSGSSDAS